MYGSAGAKHCIQASTNNNLYLDTPSGGTLFLNTSTTTSGTATFSNGSAAQGAPYSAIFGKASSTNSGQIALIDGTSNNQYTQLYCRSNVFGVQGNITSIALQKNTSVTGTLNVSGTTTLATTTITSATTTNLNMLNVPLYNGLNFSNINKASMTLAHTAVIPITICAVVGNTASSTVLQTSIVARSSNAIRITVNIPLSNWGTSATNHHMSLARTATGVPFTFGQSLTTTLVAGSYGLHHIMSGIQYDSASFSYIDNLAITVGYTYTYCIVVRQNTIASAGNIGNSNYSEITVEEIY